jgi:hypothetical protein
MTALLSACMGAADNLEEENIDPSLVSVRAMWQKLQETHVLRGQK